MDALRLTGVSKTFGDKHAVAGLDLVVPAGGLYGFIGPNGAGKTTTIRMIMSILFPDTGELTVLGRRSALEAKDRIGYLPEERGVYRRKMTAGAFLAFIARLKGLPGDAAEARVGPLLERVGLPGVARTRCDELSKGMLQRVQFAACIIHEPELLILDEPLSGLDPVSSRLLRQIILEEHRRGATIVLSTHQMSQAEEMCQHVVMIHQGRKVLDESLAGMRRRFKPSTVMFEPLDPHADLAPIHALPEVARVDARDDGFEITLVPGAAATSALPRIAAACAPARIELARVSLEDVFIAIASGAESGGAGRGVMQPAGAEA